MTDLADRQQYVCEDRRLDFGEAPSLGFDERSTYRRLLALPARVATACNLKDDAPVGNCIRAFGPAVD